MKQFKLPDLKKLTNQQDEQTPNSPKKKRKIRPWQGSEVRDEEKPSPKLEVKVKDLLELIIEKGERE